MTAERFAKAKKLKMAVTPGVGLDYIIYRPQWTTASWWPRSSTATRTAWPSTSRHALCFCSGAESHPFYSGVIKGGWNIADGVARSYDLEGMQVGTVAAGRIGSAVLRRLKPFDVGLHYFDRHRLPDEVEQELGVTHHDSVESLVSVCDVVTINAPLHPETEDLFDEQLLAQMKRGAYLINTARGRIVNRDAVVKALETGQLAGYAGDVWYPQPAPADHPWRTMPHHGMTPHTSGTSLSAQTRYAAGTREILECFLERPADPRGVPDRARAARWPAPGAHPYSAGSAARRANREADAADA